MSFADDVVNGNYKTSNNYTKKKKNKSFADKVVTGEIEDKYSSVLFPVQKQETTTQQKDDGFLETAKNLVKNSYKTTLSILFPAFNVVNTGSKIVDSIKNNDGKIVHENELMQDGYDFGDVTKTILGTTGDLAGNFVSGIMNTGEGIGDLISYARAGINRALGNDEKADKIIEAAKDNAIQLTWDYIRDKTGISKSSVAGTKTNEVVQGLGNATTMIATGNLGAAAGLGSKGTTVATSLVTGTSSMGSGMSEAYQGGATDEEALKYGIISGVAEAGTELMFGGLGKWNNAVGISKSAIGLDDAVAKKVASKFKSQLAKNLAQYTIKAGAEGVEELVSGIIQGFGKWLTYRSEDELGDILKDEQLLDQFISGMIIAGISSAPGLVKTTSQSRDYVTGRTQNEQSVVDKEVQNRIAEQEKDGKKLSTKEINAITEQVESDFEEGQISTKTIEDTLGMQNYVNEIVKDFENKSGKPVSEQDYKTIYNEVRNNFINEIGKKDTGLLRSYEEAYQKTQKFNVDLDKVAPELRDFYKTQMNEVADNSRKAHKYIDMMANIYKDKAIMSHLINNEEARKVLINDEIDKYMSKNKLSTLTAEQRQQLEKEFADKFKTTTVNGFMRNGELYVNIDSKNALESIVGHELTHTLEKNKELYDNLRKSLQEYAESTGEYDARLKAIQSQPGYSDLDLDAQTKELTADLVGDYIFTSQDYINNLAQNRNLFQKIFDEIKYMLKQVTSGSQEERQLRKAMKMFEKAYRDSGIKNAVKEGNQFSLAYLDKAILNDAQKKRVYDAIDMKNKGATDEQIWHDTGVVLGDTLADSRIYVPDLHFKSTSELRNIMRVGKELKLSDVMEGKLFDAYPNLKDTKIGVYDFEKEVMNDNKYSQKEKDIYKDVKGAVTTDGTILLNTNMDDIDEAKGVIAHEVQHFIQKESGNDENTEKLLEEKGTKDYRMNPTELEAEVTRVMNKMTEKELKNINPQSVKDEIVKFYKENNYGQLDINKVINNLVNKHGIQYSLSTIPLEQRLTGDELLDAQDLIDELTSVGANVDSNGFVTVYHQTTNENAQKIKETGKMSGKENGIFFSTSKNASQADGRGTTKLEFKIPAEKLILDDLFDDNADLKINSRPGEQIDISNYLVDNNTKYSLSNEKNYKGSHQIENAKSIIDIDLEDVVNKVEEVNGYLSKQDTSDLNKLKKIINNSNESVKIYRAAPINELNNGDWVTTDKSYAQNVANNNGGKVYTYEVNANQLYYPDDVSQLPSLHRLSSFQYQGDNINDDINLSLSQQEEIAPVKNPNLTYGEDIKYRDAVEEEIAPVRQEISNINTRIDEIRKEYDDKEKELRNELESLKALREDYQRENQSLTEEQALARDEELRGYTPEYIPEEQIDTGYSPVTALDDKTLNKYVKHFKNDFKLNTKQTREFTDMVRQLSANPELTKKDVANYIYKNFGKEEIKTLNEDVNEIRSELRNTLIGVPENVKEEIASTHDGYGKFRKKYFGKLKLGDYNGTNAIDQIYKQLTEQYPNVFNEEITSNPTDQLLQLAEITDMDRYYSVFEELPKEYVDGYVDELYSMIKDYRNESTQKLVENEKVPNSYYDNMAVEEFENNTYENLENRINQLEDELAILPAERQQKETAVKNIDNFNNVEPTIQPDKKDIMELFDAQRQRNEGKKTELVKPVIAKEKSKLRTTIDTLKSALINENTEIDNLAKESGNNNIKFAGDMLNNYTGEAQYDIEAAQTDINGNEITYEDGKKAKGVNQLFQPAKDKGLDVIFNDLLFHYSNVDRWKNGKGSQTPMDISQKQIADYEAKFPELRQWAEDVWRYGENARKNMVDAGLITQDLSNYLAETYPHYVPYISDVSNFDSLAESMNELRAKGLKRAKGGSGQILPIQEALARYTLSQKGAIRRNNMYREIVNTLSAIDGVANSTPDARSSDLTNLDNNVFRDDKGDYFLTAYIDGEEKTVKITESLFKGIRKDMANHVRDFESKLSAILNPVQKVSNVRRKLLTTWSPTFLVKNVIKDIQDGLFNSKHTGGLVKNYFPGIVELVKNNTPEVRQFKALYGTDALRGQYEDALYQTDGKAKNKKFLKGLMSANEIMELAPRYAEFKASLQAGESVEQAMYNAREVTTNFSRGGTITKALNRNGFTFLNANVQGFDKFIRNFSGENGAKGIVNSLIKAVALGIAPAVLNELAFGLGDDKDEDYDALPDYIKDNYYLIKTSDGNFIRIPKGRMLSVFGSAGRRTLELAQGEEDAFEGYLSNVNNQIGISNPEENNIFAPLIQAYGSENGTAWYGGDIVPSRLQDKPVEEQYDASTDKMSIWLGDKLGISPYKLNYVIDQYTGGIGDLVLPMITDEAKSDGSLLAPIKDQFTADSTTDNKYVSDFYDKKDELYVKSNGSKATDEDKVKEQYLYDISKEMGKLYAERRDVQADNSLSKEEKYKKAQEIKKVINKLAKDGLDTYEKVEITGNYASVNDKDFYKNAKGNWTEVKDDEKEKVDSMGLTNHEKDSYFTTSNEIYEINQKWKDINNSSGIKKKEIINSIIKADIPDEAKASLYDKNYASTDTLNAVLGCGIDFNSYLDLQAQNFSADKDDNGKSINGSKKAKIYDYINDMNIPYEKKIMLAKLEYPSDNRYNYEIIDELNNDPSITYQDMSDILKAMGFKVDIYGNITW